MTWDEMIREILTDIVKILGSDSSVNHVMAVVQWQGKIIARPVYQPSIIELVGDGGLTTGMSMMPEPPSDWKPVKLKFVPKVDGKPSKADTPLAYYLASEKGDGVAFPARFKGLGGDEKEEGKIAWTHNPEIIEHVRDMLLVASLLEMKLTEKSNG
jgi:hypothetical protein